MVWIKQTRYNMLIIASLEALAGRFCCPKARCSSSNLDLLPCGQLNTRFSHVPRMKLNEETLCKDLLSIKARTGVRCQAKPTRFVVAA